VRYQAVHWLHEIKGEPVMLYSEIKGEGHEVHKVEQYGDGRLDLADHVTQTGSTVLSETPIPSLDDINAQADFEARSITKEEFEKVWRIALCPSGPLSAKGRALAFTLTVLLISRDAQSGYGRRGALWSTERLGMRPLRFRSPPSPFSAGGSPDGLPSFSRERTEIVG
jgi:hypothetical protein